MTEFQAVQGFERNRAGERVTGDDGQPILTRVIGIEEDSGERVTPMVALHAQRPKPLGSNSLRGRYRAIPKSKAFSLKDGTLFGKALLYCLEHAAEQPLQGSFDGPWPVTVHSLSKGLEEWVDQVEEQYSAHQTFVHEACCACRRAGGGGLYGDRDRRADRRGTFL